MNAEYSPEQIDAFLKSRMALVIAAANRQIRLNLAEYGSGQDFRSMHDTALRFLSEMPLCRCYARDFLPEGFKIVEGGLVITQDSRMPLSHAYARNPAGQILCLFPGQFVGRDNQQLMKGERISILKERSPEHVAVLDEDKGIARLYGTRLEIFSSLGIDYFSPARR